MERGALSIAFASSYNLNLSNSVGLTCVLRLTVSLSNSGGWYLSSLFTSDLTYSLNLSNSGGWYLSLKPLAKPPPLQSPGGEFGSLEIYKSLDPRTE